MSRNYYRSIWNFDSLYICLQDGRIISFSVVNITEKLRCCQLDLGHFFSMIGKNCLRKLGNNLLSFERIVKREKINSLKFFSYVYYQK